MRFELVLGRSYKRRATDSQYRFYPVECDGFKVVRKRSGICEGFDQLPRIETLKDCVTNNQNEKEKEVKLDFFLSFMDFLHKFKLY